MAPLIRRRVVILVLKFPFQVMYIIIIPSVY